MTAYVKDYKNANVNEINKKIEVGRLINWLTIIAAILKQKFKRIIR